MEGMFSEPRVEATKCLMAFAEDYAIPEENTILHEIVTGVPAYITIQDRTYVVPDPTHLPRRVITAFGVKVEAVILRPPFTFLHRMMLCKNDLTLLNKEINDFADWLHGSKNYTGAYGKLLEDCTSYRVPAIWAYNMCHPAVPPGEVWVSGQVDNACGHLMRFPMASDAVLQEVTVRMVDYPIPMIFTNPHEYKTRHLGDSDGDQSYVIEHAHKHAEAQTTTLPNLVYNLTAKPTKIECKQKDIITLVRGYQAKKVVGLITWISWGLSAAHMCRLKSRDAYKEFWNFSGQLLELAFDGRKEGVTFDKSILNACMGKDTIDVETATALGCPTLPETLFYAFTTKKSLGFQMWLGRFRGVLPTNPELVVEALRQVWRGEYTVETGQ